MKAVIFKYDLELVIDKPGRIGRYVFKNQAKVLNVSPTETGDDFLLGLISKTRKKFGIPGKGRKADGNFRDEAGKEYYVIEYQWAKFIVKNWSVNLISDDGQYGKKGMITPEVTIFKVNEIPEVWKPAAEITYTGDCKDTYYDILMKQICKMYFNDSKERRPVELEKGKTYELETDFGSLLIEFRVTEKLEPTVEGEGMEMTFRV